MEKFNSLPTLNYPQEISASNLEASSLLSLNSLYAQTLLTYDIKISPDLGPVVQEKIEITDEEIFLDLHLQEHESIPSSAHQASRMSFINANPSYNPEHSLYSKLKSNVKRWTKSIDMERALIKHQTLPVLKKEMKQVRMAVERVLDKKKSFREEKLLDNIQMPAVIPSLRNKSSELSLRKKMTTLSKPKSIEAKLKKIEKNTSLEKSKSTSSIFHIKPSSVVFRNCVPGKSYKQIVQIRNPTSHIVSYSVDPIDTAVSNVLTVNPLLSSSISPGLKWELEMQFFTAWDMKNDIHSSIKYKSNLGDVYTIPVTAELKQETSFVKVEDKKFVFGKDADINVNFGKCFFKRTKKQIFSVVNDGLYDGTFHWDGSLSESFSMDRKEVRLKAGESSFFTLSYFPLGFESSTSTVFKFVHTETCRSLNVICSSILPSRALRVNKTAIDLENCTPNKIYYAEFELFNQQKAALEFDVEIYLNRIKKQKHASPDSRIWKSDREGLDEFGSQTPRKLSINSVFVKALNSEIEVFPKRGLIQRGSSIKLTVKWVKHVTKEPENFDFVIPIFLCYRAQREIVTCEIKGTVASSGFVLLQNDQEILRNSSSTTKLQPQTVFDNKVEKLCLHNPSIIPQEFRISSETANVKISETVVKLEKFESKFVEIIVSDLKPEENKFNVIFQSPFHTCLFPFSVLGISPPVYFTKSILNFDPIPLLSMKEISTKICFNTEADPDEDYEYEYTFGEPSVISSSIAEIEAGEKKWSYLDVKACPLQILPRQALLQQSDMITVKLIASPIVIQTEANINELIPNTQTEISENLDKKMKPPARSAKGDKSKKEIEVPIVVAIEKPASKLHSKLNNFRNTTINYVVPCTIRRYASEKQLLKRLLNAVKIDDHMMKEIEESIELHVIVPIVRPDYYFYDEEVSARKAPMKIDFGKSVLGQRNTKYIPIKIVSKLPMTITKITSDESIFAFSNLDKVNTDTEQLSVECFPTVNGVFETIFELNIGHTSTRITLCTEAYTPKLIISTNQLQFPDTLIGEQNTQCVSFRNAGDYPIKIETKIVGTQVYSMNLASELIIQPSTSTDVSVIFKPISSKFEKNAGLQVKYLGQSEDIFVTFIGRGCETTGSITGFDTNKEALSLKEKSIEFTIIDNFCESETGSSANRETVPAKPEQPVKSLTDIKRSSVASLTIIDKFKSYKYYRYAVYTFPGVDLCINNFKPLTKMDNSQKKQSSSLTYTIEPYDGSFYVDINKRHVLAEGTGKAFHFFDLPLSGSLESGQSKKLVVKRIEDVAQNEGEKIVSFFRIILSGGYRVVEKRVVPAEEPTVYIVKIVE